VLLFVVNPDLVGVRACCVLSSVAVIDLDLVIGLDLVIVLNPDLVRIHAPRPLPSSATRIILMHDSRHEPHMQVRREPELGAERPQEAHQRRRPELARADVGREERLALYERARVAVLLDRVRPVVREEYAWLRELVRGAGKVGERV
jgi:hypothetical protein